MKRSLRSVMLGSVLSVLLTTGTAVAVPAYASSDHDQKAADAQTLQKFVQDLHNQWNINIDPAAYEVRKDATGTTVAPKGSTIKATRSNGRVEYSTVIQAPNTPAAAAQTANGPVTIQSEPKWYEETCFDDENDVAWMHTCFQFGEMEYLNPTRHNMVHRMWARCGAREGGPDFWQLDRCRVQARRSDLPSSPRITVGDFSPGSTISLPSCREVPLSISAGPVSAAMNIHACERIIPSYGFGDVPWMQTQWEGGSYWASQVRETGQLWGISTPLGTNPLLNMQWGYASSTCEPPPKLIDPCNMFGA